MDWALKWPRSRDRAARLAFRIFSQTWCTSAAFVRPGWPGALAIGSSRIGGGRGHVRQGHLRYGCVRGRDDAGEGLDLRIAALSGECFRRLDDRPIESFSERFATDALAAHYWNSLF